jgi:hypothetical protein
VTRTATVQARCPSTSPPVRCIRGGRAWRAWPSSRFSQVRPRSASGTDDVPRSISRFSRRMRSTAAMFYGTPMYVIGPADGAPPIALAAITPDGESSWVGAADRTFRSGSVARSLG